MHGSVLEVTGTLMSGGVRSLKTGDDHLAWKRPVSLEACRGLHAVGGMIASTRDPLKSTHIHLSHLDLVGSDFVHSLDTPSWVRVEGRLVRYSERQGLLHPLLSGPLSLMTRMPRMDHIEQRVRQLRVSDGYAIWDDLEGMPVASFPAKFRMPDVERRELEALRQRADESISFIYLPPRINRHVVGVPFADFGSLVLALYNVKDDISRGLWADSSSSDVKRKKPFGGQRSTDVSAISSSSKRPSRRHQPVPQLLKAHLSYTPQQALRGLLFHTRPLDSHAMLHSSLRGPTPSYLRPRAQQTLCTLCFEDAKTVFADRHAVEPGSLEAHRGRGPGHETDRCTTLRHAIQDLIDQGLVRLGQLGVTQNPLPTPRRRVRFPLQLIACTPIDFTEFDDHIHMLSDDDSDPEPIMPDVIYEMSGVILGPRMPVPFRLVPEAASAPHVDDSQTLDIQYVLRGGRVIRQQPPAAARPLEASSSTHRDALTRALSQIKIDTTTTPEGLIHMMTAGRRVPSVFPDNGSVLNVCPLATAIALGYTHPPISVLPRRQFELTTILGGRLWVPTED
ncbi:hypothetical protein CK203_049447 [Vitis vinifera]|uniref:Uncharacterized protein n=1 Tax=Vitis vinifera TaxID=29760 RepID=A0A438HAW6_VITVI|nr:hypothetical protein CK203_049447 [Vitis vinifera]